MSGAKQKIVVSYRSIDGVSMSRTYKTLDRARRFAQLYVGATPEMSSRYAVSGDGVGRITCQGCQLQDLFPQAAA